MKRVFYIAVVLLISASVFFGYNYATKNLKSHLLTFLEQNFNAKLSIGRVGIYLPLCLELKDVNIENIITAKNVRIYPMPAFSLLKNKVIVSSVKVIEPVISIKKENATKFLRFDFSKKRETSSLTKIGSPNLYFSRIQIKNGTLIYDGGNGNSFEFVRIKANIEIPGFYFSKDRVYHFAATGFLRNKGSDFLSPLRVNGHGRFGNKINARLQASGVKLGTFDPIYTKYLSQLLKEGRVNFESNVQISKNSLIAKCFVEGEDLVLKIGEGRKIDVPLAANFILLINFKNNLVKIKNLQSNLLQIISNQL